MRYYIIIIVLAIFIGCGDHYTKELIKAKPTSIPLLIKNTQIFNGKDSLIIEGQDVIVKDGRIVSISTTGSAAEADYQVIDATGMTLMPGMVDAHVHLSGSGAVPWNNVQPNMEYNLSAYLYAGVTTVYDLGGLASQIGKLSDRVAAGDIIGPNIYHTHIPITVKNGHPIPLTEEMLSWPLKAFVNTLSPLLGEIDKIPAAIESYVDRDIDYVKIICDQIPPGSPQITFEQLKTAIDAAHSLGYKTFVHIGSPENAMMAINAGADVLAHGVWRGALQPQQANAIAASGVPIIYTLSGFHNVNKIYEGEFAPSAMDTLLVPQAVISPVTGSKGHDVQGQPIMSQFFKDVSDKNAYLKRNFEMLRDRGVPILVGTDSSLPGTYAGSTYLQELQMLSEFGLSNFQVLKGATYLPARLFLDSPDFGYVKEGMKADLLLVDGNPLIDLMTISEPTLILKNGKVIDRLINASN